MSDKIKLGTKPLSTDGRDAVHIAITPCIAAERLRVGQHVGLNSEGQATLYGDLIGVVDPFLTTKVVNKGDTFWLCLYPNTITSLRHVWEHPKFKDSKTEENGDGPNQTIPIAYNEIKNIAEDLGVDTDELISRAGQYIRYGNYWNGGELFEGLYLPESFWTYYEIYTGTKVDDNDKQSFFTCSC